jgi:poly-gamma-glutamate capsule biosynthesis protein CapA/YwtB (metallophosphatase superfamily)
MRFLSLFVLVVLCLNTAVGQKIKFRALDDSDGEMEKIDSFTKLHIVLAGNIYKSEEQIKNSYDRIERRYDFSQELKHVNPILNIGHLVIAQLKTAFTADPESPYSAPDEYALALKYSGINLCMLANKNTANIDKRGLLRTQRALGAFDINTTGAFTDNIQRNGNYPLYIEKKGFKIAVLNYSSITKRPSVSLDFLINQIDQSQIERDMKMVRDQKADYIIVYLDWGENFQDYPSYSQEQMAKFILEQGANLIVGTFPNTVQKFEIVQHYYLTKPRFGLVAYSLGNLVSGTKDDRSKSGALLDIEIFKNNFTGEVREGDFGFIPIWNYYDTIRGKTELQVVPVAAVESRNLYKNFPEAERVKMLKFAALTRGTMGRYSDEIQYNITDITVEDIEESAQITNAPVNNKFNPFRETSLAPSAAPVVKAPSRMKADTVYRVQFYELSRSIPIDTNYYDHLKGYEVLKENESYKYLIGYGSNFAEIRDLYFNVIRPRYKQSLVAVYYDGKRIREYTPVP